MQFKRELGQFACPMPERAVTVRYLTAVKAWLDMQDDVRRLSVREKET
jgi:hypothetical protein